jgi:hypothetical protein
MRLIREASSQRKYVRIIERSILGHTLSHRVPSVEVDINAPQHISEHTIDRVSSSH